jgi:probable phosphoglycerate mutase
MGHLILVRHSTTDASAGGRNLGQGSDPPLAAAGRARARQLGTELRAELADLPFAEVRLVTSPALRCLQTMDLVTAEAGLRGTPEEEPALLEINYGRWEGLTADECRAQDPELRAAWEADPFDTRAPQGESGRDVAERSFPVFARLEAWLRADRARLALVMAHNHVNRLRLTQLIGWPLSSYRRRLAQDPASYSIVGFGAAVTGAQAPRIRRVSIGQA